MKKVVIANLKCNPKTLKEAEMLFAFYNKIKSKHEIVICPGFCFLEKAGKTLKNVGAQDCFYKDEGPFTGQVSPLQLKSVGVKYVILGHSEKRALGETDKIINLKVKAALKAGLCPILCLGETIQTREKEKTFSLLKSQLLTCLAGVAKNQLENLVLAYEPVWAIGTSKPCQVDEAVTCILYLKKLISEAYTKKTQSIRVVYGGSINALNAKDYLENRWIDGLLVGSASLNKAEFMKIATL